MAKFKSIENEEQLFTADLDLNDLVNFALNKRKNIKSDNKENSMTTSEIKSNEVK